MFNRLFFCLFLLVFSSQSFAKDWVYWMNRGGTFCSNNLDTVCNNYPKVNFYHGSNCTTTALVCKPDYNGYIKFSGTCPAAPPSDTFTEWAQSTTYYTKQIKSCPDDKVMMLHGEGSCTAECVEDPCKAYQDQTTSQLVSCGTATCTNGGLIQGGTGSLSCSKGSGVHLRSPASSVTVAGCSANTPTGANRTLVKASDAVGKMSSAAFCYANYTYTGASSTDEPVITGVTDLSFVDFSPTTEDGACPPDKPKKGQMGDTFVCYSNGSNSGGECPTGQIKNNSGACVPFSEAGISPTGTNGTGSGTGTGGTGTGTGGTGSGGTGTGTGSGLGGDGICSANSGTQTNVDPDCVTGGGTANGGTGTGGTGTGGTGTGGTGTGGTGTGGTGTGGTGTGTSGSGGSGGSCDPTKSICDGDGTASTGTLGKPSKIENTIKLSWYSSKYPTGLKGVWDSHQAAMNNTPFVQSLNQFKQGVPNTGGCPSFHIPLGQFSGVLAPPCFIWPILRAFFLFSTMMVCRRIVFGG